MSAILTFSFSKEQSEQLKKDVDAEMNAFESSLDKIVGVSAQREALLNREDKYRDTIDMIHDREDISNPIMQLQIQFNRDCATRIQQRLQALDLANSAATPAPLTFSPAASVEQHGPAIAAPAGASADVTRSASSPTR